MVVVIGDIKSGSNYNIKQRGNLLAPGVTTGPEKPKTTGKFSIEEFESVGTISGQLAHEFSIDSLDEKPWRKPGADITDYFNYGFNEETWRAYCEKQKKMRLHESGVGLQGLAAASSNAQGGNSNSEYHALIFILGLMSLQFHSICFISVSSRTLSSVTSNDNSKYPTTGPPHANAGPPKFQNRPGLGAPPGRNGINIKFIHQLDSLFVENQTKTTQNSVSILFTIFVKFNIFSLFRFCDYLLYAQNKYNFLFLY